MGYQLAMEVAGATVHAFKEFGSYQGTWLAKVTYQDQTGWVEGWYGSCTGCDAFQGEFGYDSRPVLGERDIWGGEMGWLCVEQTHVDAYDNRLKEFGLRYLSNQFLSQEELEARLSRSVAEQDWDDEASLMLNFVRSLSGVIQ